MDVIQVLEQVELSGIQLYPLPDCDDDEDEDYKEQCRQLKVSSRSFLSCYRSHEGQGHSITVEGHFSVINCWLNAMQQVSVISVSLHDSLSVFYYFTV